MCQHTHTRTLVHNVWWRVRMCANVTVHLWPTRLAAPQTIAASLQTQPKNPSAGTETHRQYMRLYARVLAFIMCAPIRNPYTHVHTHAFELAIIKWGPRARPDEISATLNYIQFSAEPNRHSRTHTMVFGYTELGFDGNGSCPMQAIFSHRISNNRTATATMRTHTHSNTRLHHSVNSN